MKEPPKTKGPGAVRRIQGPRKSNFCRQSITSGVRSLAPFGSAEWIVHRWLRGGGR
jgi:hypothetical protein